MGRGVCRGEFLGDGCRDLASDPSTRLFRRAIVIFDGQKNHHDGFVYRRAK